MILTAHQPVYLPWLGLFHKISLADKFCYFDDVQYEPRGWNNRNYIKGANGEKLLLTVPVLSKGHREKSYLNIRINNDAKWQKKHWRSIEFAYKKAKFFNVYAEGLMYFYTKKWDFLVDLNYEMLNYFLHILGIEVDLVRMGDFNFSGEKSDLVLDMCINLNADHYIFGELGEDYAVDKKFNEAGITLDFQKYVHPAYDQLDKNFTANLSIIDLLFNEGPKAYEILAFNNDIKHKEII